MTEQAYDHPTFTVDRAEYIQGAATTGEVKRFRTLDKLRISQVHATVVTAGTTTACGYTVVVGTTTVGAVTVGTATAGSTATLAFGTNSDVMTAGAGMTLTKNADATGVIDLVMPYNILP